MSNDLSLIIINPGFHSIDFPSEWGHGYARDDRRKPCRVSIQLISPASGDTSGTVTIVVDSNSSFHSIDFPSEWGLIFQAIASSLLERFHSIDFPSEWGHICLALAYVYATICFHSIDFPSEWGQV